MMTPRPPASSPAGEAVCVVVVCRSFGSALKSPQKVADKKEKQDNKG